MLLLCHCILNVNSRAPGIARWKNVVKPVWDIMRREGYQFIQLPCPEAFYLGLRRWWFVKEQYSNALFKDLCKKMSIGCSEILLENKIKRFKLLCLGISPSCGYRETQSDPSWGGSPREVDIESNITTGPGVLIETMDKIFRDYGFSYEIYDLPPSIIYPRERVGVKKYPRNFKDSVRELSEFLGFNYKLLNLDEYDEYVDSDIRSRKILVCPYEAIEKDIETIEKYIDEGYGLMIVPKSNNLTLEKEEIAFMFALQVENHLEIGHQITLYNYNEYSLLFQKFIKFLRERDLLEKISVLR
ncbi:MAG: hypothetical protein N3G77_03595 [Nitrososphaeria archaeon]|nr:hypothetical protein [Nitrososphaeria archaeon]